MVEQSLEQSRISNLTTMVFEVLEGSPLTRNSDVLLTAEIWKRFFNGIVHYGYNGAYIFLDDMPTLPREDEIKRIRARIQNERKMFLPTNWETAKRRGIKEEEWKKYAVEPDLFPGMESSRAQD